MSDIALMVAEESEKRLKRGAPGGGGSGGAGGDDEASKGRRNFGAVAKVCGSWVESASAAASGVKVHVALLVKTDMEEPRTGLALAAFDGFFSA